MSKLLLKKTKWCCKWLIKHTVGRFWPLVIYLPKYPSDDQDDAFVDQLKKKLAEMSDEEINDVLDRVDKKQRDAYHEMVKNLFKKYSKRKEDKEYRQ